MGYLLKEEMANIFSKKYKNSYIAELIGLSGTYVSIIMHRKQKVPKRVAYAFAKAINPEAEINDYFDLVR